jgi:predicted phage tail protein
MIGTWRRAMAQRPYYKFGVGLIVAGAAFIALNLWFLSTIHWASGIRGGNAGLAVIGATMIISGIMVLLGC